MSLQYKRIRVRYNSSKTESILTTWIEPKPGDTGHVKLDYYNNLNRVVVTVCNENQIPKREYVFNLKKVVFIERVIQE